MNYVPKGNNKYYFNSPQKPKQAGNLHDYYKSIADQKLTQSDPTKLIKSSAQLKPKGLETKSTEIVFQNNQITVRNPAGKFVIKNKPKEEEPPVRRNSKIGSDGLGAVDNKKRPSRVALSYDSNIKKIEKNDIKLPKIENNVTEIPKKNYQFFTPDQLKKEHEPIKKEQTNITVHPFNGVAAKMDSSKGINNFNINKEQNEEIEEIQDPSPVISNRNMRIVTKHSVIQMKDTNQQPDLSNNQNNQININIKNQKRLSDAGLNLEALQSLASKYEEKKETKSAHKMSDSGVLTFGNKGESKSSPSNADKMTITPEKSQLFSENKSNQKTFSSIVRTITNFAFKSRAGAMPGNITKTNQDVYIAIPSFANSKEKSYFAVCDGHGVNGHFVSGYIKQHLPKFVEKVYKEQSENDSSEMIKNALLEGHLQTFHGLIETNIDSNFSGSTSVSVLLTENRAFCANVGDSRAIICKCKNGQWSAVPLSRDQKPDDPFEMQRILKCGGRVEAFKDFMGNPVGPARVWLKHENIPGLAMARSLGDRIASQVGVIPEPEIKEFELTDDDKFIVICSDGVWEFLSNQQVMNYVVPFYLKNQPEAACEKLIKESVICWRREDEVIDDITAIVVCFSMK